MKLSAAIEALQAMLREHGDVELWMQSETVDMTEAPVDEIFFAPEHEMTLGKGDVAPKRVLILP